MNENKLTFSHSELPWQQNVSRLSIQYQIEQDEKKKMEKEELDRIEFIRKKKMQEETEQNEIERRASESWSDWLKSYWINMDYSTTTSDDSRNTGSAFDDFTNAGPLVPTPSASARVPVPSGTRPGRVSNAPDRTSTAGSDFKKSRVSQRERMSTNYIW